eukprot:1161179-Pelagomonas_calceolata.AAC.12
MERRGSSGAATIRSCFYKAGRPAMFFTAKTQDRNRGAPLGLAVRGRKGQEKRGKERKGKGNTAVPSSQGP